MPKPKVLFLIDGLQVGGAERSLLLLCQHLSEFTPIVLVLSNSLALRPEYEASGIEVLVKPLPRDYRFWSHAKRLKPLIDSIHPAIIHSSLFHADMILRYLDTPAKKVTGLVSTMYSEGRLRQMAWLTRKKIMILKCWDSWTSGKIDLFLANSHSIKRLYQEKVGYSSDKVKVIFRGRNFTESKTESARKKNEFLFIGRLIHSKGLREAVNAFAIFSKDHPDASFVLAGEGPERETLSSLTRFLGVEQKVRFLGHVSQVQELLQEADYFLFPSHYEGLPGALIEAMMARVPIICSDIRENNECLDESMCLFHRVGDQQDLLSQMKKAITLNDWPERTQRAFDFAATHFEIGKIARQYEEVYQHLIESKQSNW